MTTAPGRRHTYRILSTDEFTGEQGNVLIVCDEDDCKVLLPDGSAFPLPDADTTTMAEFTEWLSRLMWIEFPKSIAPRLLRFIPPKRKVPRHEATATDLRTG